ncbi:MULTISPECIES: hypothetical protein [unclassified Fusobacterium]|uniref:hypothetical protein n=1 Tax=unclassified Fusobacterium TaxID=2648384 RepID=UPI001B8CA275|nr:MULTISPECIES: hypothetical protein [unclassified Fusobacterium]
MNKCSWKSILDIGDVERAIKGKTYPAKSILIPLSAMISTPMEILENSGEVETKYAVLVVAEDHNPKYIFTSMERDWNRFITKYATTINLQFDALKNFIIPVHDKPTQDYIAYRINLIDTALEKEKKLIERTTIVKKHLLNDMFVS